MFENSKGAQWKRITSTTNTYKALYTQLASSVKNWHKRYRYSHSPAGWPNADPFHCRFTYHPRALKFTLRHEVTTLLPRRLILLASHVGRPSHAALREIGGLLHPAEGTRGSGYAAPRRIFYLRGGPEERATRIIRPGSRALILLGCTFGWHRGGGRVNPVRPEAREIRAARSARRHLNNRPLGSAGARRRRLSGPGKNARTRLYRERI